MATPAAGGNRRIDRVLDPSFVEGLAELSLAEVRSRRQEADQEEVDLSYLRRLLQGRSDIVAAELARRSAGAAGTTGTTGATGTGTDPETTEQEMVARLSAVLADDGHGRTPAQGLGRHRPTEPSRVGETRRRGESLLASSGVTDLETRSEEELRAQLDDLATQEHEVSAQRKQVQAVLDALSAEVGRRYREGSATVDALLGGS